MPQDASATEALASNLIYSGLQPTVLAMASNLDASGMSGTFGASAFLPQTYCQ